MFLLHVRMVHGYLSVILIAYLYFSAVELCDFTCVCTCTCTAIVLVCINHMYMYVHIHAYLWLRHFLSMIILIEAHPVRQYTPSVPSVLAACLLCVD